MNSRSRVHLGPRSPHSLQRPLLDYTLKRKRGTRIDPHRADRYQVLKWHYQPYTVETLRQGYQSIRKPCTKPLKTYTQKGLGRPCTEIRRMAASGFKGCLARAFWRRPPEQGATRSELILSSVHAMGPGQMWEAAGPIVAHVNRVDAHAAMRIDFATPSHRCAPFGVQARLRGRPRHRRSSPVLARASTRQRDGGARGGERPPLPHSVVALIPTRKNVPDN